MSLSVLQNQISEDLLSNKIQLKTIRKLFIKRYFRYRYNYLNKRVSKRGKGSPKIPNFAQPYSERPKKVIFCSIFVGIEWKVLIPMAKAFQMVPITAYNKIDMRLSKKRRFGI